MGNRRGTYRGTDERRSAIIVAALACFTAKDYVNTTMEDIRRRSGASNGSVYHHVKSKEHLASEVYLAGIVSYQNGLTRALARSTGCRQGIRAMVRYHLLWVKSNPDWAGFLVRMRHAHFMGGAEDALRAANAGFSSEIGTFFRRHVADGSLRRLPPDLYLALILGPCQEFARRWLLAGEPVSLNGAIRELADSACRAVCTPEGTGRASG
jgi:AcrR family transcriptional regulator